MLWMEILPRIKFKDLMGNPQKLDGKSSWAQSDWLDIAVVWDQAFGKGHKSNRARVELPKVVRAAEKAGEDYAPIDDGWEPFLKNAVNKPDTPPHPVIDVQCLPFQEAALNLLKTRPESKKKAPAKPKRAKKKKPAKAKAK